MRISFQTKPNSRLDLEFGFDTPLFSGMYWFSIIRVYFDYVDSDDLGPNIEITNANIVFEFLMHPKHWRDVFKGNYFGNTTWKRVKSIIYS